MKKYIAASAIDISTATEKELVEIARRPNLRIGTLTELAASKYWVVRGAVALNPKTPLNLLQQLATDDNVYVCRAVFNNSNTPADMREHMYKLGTQEFKECIANDPDTDPDVLAWLALDSVDVRFLVARNRHTPAQVLRDLSREPGRVSWGVASNPGAPKELLGDLASSDNPLIRSAVAENENTDLYTLTLLMKDENTTVAYQARKACYRRSASV